MRERDVQGRMDEEVVEQIGEVRKRPRGLRKLGYHYIVLFKLVLFKFHTVCCFIETFHQSFCLPTDVHFQSNVGSVCTVKIYRFVCAHIK